MNVPCVFEPINGLSHRLVRHVKALGDTSDEVTTLDGEDDLRRRVVEHLVHLVVINDPVTIKKSCLIGDEATISPLVRRVALIPVKNHLERE